MKHALLGGIAALSLFSCGAPSTDNDPTGSPVADTNWIGEAHITKGDTIIRLCGSGKRYRLSGPDLDTLALRYHHASMTTGQWMKVWLVGHLGALTNGGRTDSTLFTVKFLHLDASLHCDPVAEPRLSADWLVQEEDPNHERTIHLHLLLDGSAMMLTDLHQGHGLIEEIGTWGTDAEDHVAVHWPARDQTMLFTFDGTGLHSSVGAAGKGISLSKAGPADRLAGSFGRAARWLASAATAQGRPVRAEDLSPTTTLASLFPTDGDRQAWSATAFDTLAIPDDELKPRLAAASTVRDVVLLVRASARR